MMTDINEDKQAVVVLAEDVRKLENCVIVMAVALHMTTSQSGCEM
jgi:hypothetical protein